MKWWSVKDLLTFKACLGWAWGWRMLLSLILSFGRDKRYRGRCKKRARGDGSSAWSNAALCCEVSGLLLDGPGGG